MALIESSMLALNSPLPNIETLRVCNNKELESSSTLVAVAVICNHCPYVVHILDVFTQVFNTLTTQGINCIAISANDPVSHPADAPDNMKALAQEKGFLFPYTFDESQSVAKALKAECTPDFFLFSKTDGLVYRGQFCESRPKNGIAPSGQNFTHAVDLYLKDKSIISEQKPSIGCSIKWK